MQLLTSDCLRFLTREMEQWLAKSAWLGSAAARECFANSTALPKPSVDAIMGAVAGVFGAFVSQAEGEERHFGN